VAPAAAGLRRVSLAVFASVFVGLASSHVGRADDHAIAMHGTPALGPSYSHFSHVDPNAPKGGRLVLSRVGSFDSLNPFIVRGAPAAGLHLTFDGLLQRNWDEPFTLYALLAEAVTTPEDRGWVEFRLREGARFHDGSEVTVEDVEFSLETLRRHGRPNFRSYYAEVARVERRGPRSVRLHFGAGGNRELPLILGLMPILPKAAFAGRPFDRVSLEAIPGTGAYRVETVDPGRRVVYRRIEGHWSEDLPAARGQNNFDRIVYDYFRDEDARHLAFQSGAVHLKAEGDLRRWAMGYDFPAARGGRVQMQALPHRRPAGMFALVWNGRRELFREPQVRRALGQAFDFDWVNSTFHYGLYRRTASYFANSELAASGAPSPAELALFETHRGTLPPAVFTMPYTPPGDAAEGDLRRRLRLADRTLEAAGWVVRDGRRVDRQSGRAFAFEILLARREDERLALSYARNLERLGIEASVRQVDSTQYQERLDRFDFDAIVHGWGQSLSPGSEQAYYWGGAAAGEAGSRNYPGIADPAVDSLVHRLVDAATREELVTAARALDRVLLWGEHVLPLYHDTADRLAYWDRFGRPARSPLYGYQIETWWEDAAKAARLPAN